MSPRRVALCALAATALTAAATEARRNRVARTEERVFRAVNETPDALEVVLWPIMQMGSLGSVFLTSELLRRRDHELGHALVVAAAGTAVWGGTKLVKPLVGRGRPADLLPGVHIRGAAQSGLGFPSGHAAVSVTLALAASRSRSARVAALGAAILTGASRIYVGAHLPLDVLGGVAIGCLVGLHLAV